MDVRLRPRFRLRVDMEPDAVMELFAARKHDDPPCVLHLYEHQVEFSVRQADRHFWSPFLNLIVEPTADGATLHGKYGPNVNVWTMFLATYAVAGIAGAVGLVVAWSQSMIGQEVTGLWITVGCAVIAAIVYVLGRVGRHLARPQMVVFHDFIEAKFGPHIVEILDEEHRSDS